MNSTYLTLFLGSLLLPMASASAAQIVAEFEGVDDYMDFSVSGLREDKTLPLFKGELESDLETWARKYLTEGQTMTIVFTDIDMAGDIQPWRNRQNADIRYVEAIYPPRLKFRYSLKDAEGTVLAEGEESITDMSFQMSAIAPLQTRYDNFHYERTLLGDWMRRTLRKK